jgi:hypothetical protein
MKLSQEKDAMVFVARASIMIANSIILKVTSSHTPPLKGPAAISWESSIVKAVLLKNIVAGFRNGENTRFLPDKLNLDCSNLISFYYCMQYPSQANLLMFQKQFSLGRYVTSFHGGNIRQF